MTDSMRSAAGSTRLAIALAHWEDEATTAECLAHLARCPEATGAAWILVDNGSTDGSAERLRARYPGLVVIRNDRNVGHAAAVNAGARMAQTMGCTSIFLLDNDAFVAPDAMRILLSMLDSRPDAGIVSPRILSGRRPGLLWYDGGSLTPLGRGVHDHMWKAASTTPRKVRDVAFATACAMLVRLPAFFAAGGFDDDLITYADDLDFSIRMRKAGFAIVHVPAAEVVHGESMNVIAKAGKQFRDYFNMRNQLIVGWRHGGVVQRVVGVPFAMLAAGVVPAIVHLLRGDAARSKALFLGIADFLRGRTGWGSQ